MSLLLEEMQPLAIRLNHYNWIDWLQAVEARARHLGVWEYIDPATDSPLLNVKPELPKLSTVNSNATQYSQLSKKQRDDLRDLYSCYEMDIYEWRNLNDNIMQMWATILASFESPIAPIIARRHCTPQAVLVALQAKFRRI